MIDLYSLEHEDLIEYCMRLQRRVAQLEHDKSMQGYTDRMGGQFDQYDYEQLRRAEQGVFG